jgi:hypothetical protein
MVCNDHKNTNNNPYLTVLNLKQLAFEENLKNNGVNHHPHDFNLVGQQ